MAKSLDSIYGVDDTSAANEVSAAALSPDKPSRDLADVWGNIQDNKRAQSYANVGREPVSPDGSTDIPILRSQQDAGNFGDREALNMPEDYKTDSVKHRRGPSTSTDEGGGVKSPPKFTKAPGKVAGPAYKSSKS